MIRLVNKACEDLYLKFSAKYKIQRIAIQQKDFNEVLKADIEKRQKMQSMEELNQRGADENLEELEPA